MSTQVKEAWWEPNSRYSRIARLVRGISYHTAMSSTLTAMGSIALADAVHHWRFTLDTWLRVGVGVIGFIYGQCSHQHYMDRIRDLFRNPD